jgi:hypothetical protein
MASKLTTIFRIFLEKIGGLKSKMTSFQKNDDTRTYDTFYNSPIEAERSKNKVSVQITTIRCFGLVIAF